MEIDHLLSSQIDVQAYENEFGVFDASYQKFCEEMQDRESRPNLFGKFIYLNEYKGQYEKSKGFWHIASIGADDTKFDMDPCTNHTSQILCRYQCDVEHEENYLAEEDSIPCIYRAIKIGWIRKIIDLANDNRNHINLRIWKCTDSKTKEKTLKIRYIDESLRLDYILIFAIKYKNSDVHMYLLKTAFPVVLKSYRVRFNREYDMYLKTKK